MNKDPIVVFPEYPSNPSRLLSIFPFSEKKTQKDMNDTWNSTFWNKRGEWKESKAWPKQLAPEKSQQGLLLLDDIFPTVSFNEESIAFQAKWILFCRNSTRSLSFHYSRLESKQPPLLKIDIQHHEVFVHCSSRSVLHGNLTSLCDTLSQDS